MKKKLKKHLGYYIAFTIVQALGLILTILASGNKQTQLFAILGTTVFYFLFAVGHHMRDHDLTAKIVVEYALVGCIGLVVSMLAFNNI